MKLALGTVQFGIDYGITNAHGVTSSEEIECILKFAKDNKIDMLDTAPSYGNSESKLGNIIGGDETFHVITKTPHFQTDVITQKSIKHLRETYLCSLQNLKKSKCSGLIVHNIKDMFKENGQLIYEEMVSLKKQGLVDRIGFSVYEGYEIDHLLNNYNFDIIQVPINVFDQRLIQKGYLEKLKRKNIEVHARSVFLQGILLMEPTHIHEYFRPLLPLLTKYNNTLKEKQLTLLEGALSFVKNIREIDKIVVGVNNLPQLQQIFEAYEEALIDKVDYIKFSCDMTEMIDPRRWNNLT